METKAILEAFKAGEISLEEAEAQVLGFRDLGHTRVDLEREDRNGTAEVVFGEGKTVKQIIEIMAVMIERGQNVLVTRVQPGIASSIVEAYPQATYHELARLVQVRVKNPVLVEGQIAIVCAGTSDLPIAEEARITAEFYGNPTEPIYDAGVAGLHRLLASLDKLRSCRVVVVVAGMEGALPSVVGGLVKAPIIAVPTSVGYGASFGGVSALLTMLNSCASGVSVVNIDNGFGAGFLASRINKF
ncbi:MAG: nickel pincer cofactor biosynthesis protein LarB [Verrucomicrobiota bacterium]